MRVLINNGKEEKEVYPIDVPGWIASNKGWKEGALEKKAKAPVKKGKKEDK